MAEVQWIKIYTNMFDISRKIKKIELMEDGDTILIIWFKLLILAGKINDGGAIYITQSIPYEIEDLVEEFRRPEKIVEKALSTFEMFDMIERVDGFIYISSWEEHQNIEGLDKIREKNRLRQAKYKQKQKLLQGNVTNNVIDNVTDNVTITQGNATDIEEDKEKEIDIEEDKEKKKKEKKTPKKAQSKETPPKKAHGEYKHVLLTEDEEEKLIDEYGIELALRAIKFLDEYIEETGYKRQSHYLCIKRWVIDAAKEKEAKDIKSGKVPKARYGDFDVNDAFNKALERSYSSEQSKTAAEDPFVRERAEALKQRLS